MSETHYWPETPGKYQVLHRNGDIDEWSTPDGVSWGCGMSSPYSRADMIEAGYLGVRREAEKPANTPGPDAMVAQQALDEWRAVKQQPKAADWAYKWAVDLCERLGAR